jgi:hypothetical protein
MDRLELSEVSTKKWVSYMMANMNEKDRIWAETNIDLPSAKNANTKAEVENRFVVPFLEADNGVVMSRLDILQFHQCTWEISQLSYIDFIKQLSMLAGKAQIPDGSPSMIRLFIEKQPRDTQRYQNRSEQSRYHKGRVKGRVCFSTTVHARCCNALHFLRTIPAEEQRPLRKISRVKKETKKDPMLSVKRLRSLMSVRVDCVKAKARKELLGCRRIGKLLTHDSRNPAL